MMNRALWLAAAVALLVSPASAGIVTLPYFNDFSTSDADFAKSASSWTFGGGVLNSTLSGSGAAGNRYAIVQAPVLGGPPASAQDFVLSTLLRLNSYTTNNNPSVGTQLMTDGVGGNFGYLVDIQLEQNRFRIHEFAAGAATFVSFTPQTGVWYELTITGTYQPGGALKIDAALKNLDTLATTSVSRTTTAAVSQLNHFGYRNRRNADNSGNWNVDFDNFQLRAVPEPGTWLLLLIGGSGMALLLCRRMRRCG